MIDLNAAINFVLRQEDASMSGIITNAANDKGGRTRWGVAETSHPELSSTGFFDSMSNADSLQVAMQVYAKAYADPINLNEFVNQCVAQAALSFAINEGTHTAIKVLQQAVNYWHAATQPRTADITVDGQMGNQTLTAINAIPATNFLACLCQVQLAHYNAIVAADPSQSKWIHGWTNRTIADTKGQLGNC